MNTSIAKGRKATQNHAPQLNLFADPREMILEELKTLDIVNMTPLEALGRLGQWKERLGQG